MKKLLKKVSIIGVGVILSGSFAVSAFGFAECSEMVVVKSGTKVIGSEKINVIRVKRPNEGEATVADDSCGNMDRTLARTFNFADVNADAGLATALTALSLGKNVYLVLTDDNATNGTTVEILQVSR